MFTLCQLLTVASCGVGFDDLQQVQSWLDAGKIPFEAAPEDDRHLPDLHLALYNDVVVFDQATKIIYVISWVHLDDATTTGSTASTSNRNTSSLSSSHSSSYSMSALRKAYESGKSRLKHLVELLSSTPPCLSPGIVNMELNKLPAPPGRSNMTEQEFLDAVLQAKEYILVSNSRVSAPYNK